MNQQIAHYENKLKYEIDSWDLNQSIINNKNVTVIDTRSNEVYKISHIPGSINIPHRTMNEKTTINLDKSSLYVTYCDGIGCNASTKGALNMARLGFKVKELIGGLDWWIRDGYETKGVKGEKIQGYLVDAKQINNKIIRNVKKNEIDQLLILCEKHALYEKSDFVLLNQKENLKKHLFQTVPTLYCLVIQYENKLIGYATYMKQFSTWDAEFYLYLDCIFIDENYRSMGLGKELLEKIKKEAKRLDCNLMQWQTPMQNKKAITFYKRNNAIAKQKERFFLNI